MGDFSRIFSCFALLVSAVASLLSIISGLDAPVLRDIAWMFGDIHIEVSQMFLFKKLSLSSGKLYNYWLSLWTFCESTRGKTRCYPMNQAFSSGAFKMGGIKQGDIIPENIPIDVYWLLPGFNVLGFILIVAALICRIQSNSRRSFIIASCALLLQFVIFALNFAFMDRVMRTILLNEESFYQGILGELAAAFGELTKFTIPSTSLAENADFGPAMYISYCMFVPLILAVAFLGRIQIGGFGGKPPSYA